MIQIIFAILIFLNLLIYLIFFDVILSWLTLIWLSFRPKFLADIIDPIYKKIKNIFPTTLWPLDLTPIIVIFVIYFFTTLLIILFPEVVPYLQNLENNLKI
jgi:uncharacterized protein YggT (Ycf19 family)